MRGTSQSAVVQEREWYTHTYIYTCQFFFFYTISLVKGRDGLQTRAFNSFLLSLIDLNTSSVKKGGVGEWMKW